MVDPVATEARHDSTIAGEMVLVVSRKGSILSVLEAPERFREKGPDNPPVRLADIWPKALAKSICSNIRRTIRSRRFHSEDAENPSDGRSYEYMYVPQGQDRVLLVIRDISEIKSALSRITEIAYTDDITDLPNREFLLSELARITDMQRLRQGRAAVLCLHVEEIDAAGHTLIAGHEDDLFRELASRLTMQLRGMNDATQRNFERYSVVARTDFRQFAIVLPSIESGEDAESVIMRLIGALKQPLSIGGRSIVAKVHGGVALFPQDGTRPDTLYANAIAALEDARNSTATPFRFHSGTVRLRNLQRQDIEADLKSALENEGFLLKYLPVVDAQTGAVKSAEALLRWPETILGSRSTQKIITIADYTGLIVEIGAWVLRRACEDLRRWHEAGHDDIRMAVNLSGQEFSHARLADRVQAVLDEVGVNPSSLDLEIKEHMVFRDALHKHAICERLRSIGVGIVIDDYGTGACTLAHLSQSPIDMIKVDRSFVANIASSERDRAACSAAIALAHGLGIPAIAEGVETEEQAQFLRQQGCDLLQGFLFSRPLADAEFQSYLVNAASIATDRVRAS